MGLTPLPRSWAEPRWTQRPYADGLFAAMYVVAVLASQAFALESIRFTPFFPPAGVMLWWLMHQGNVGLPTALAVRLGCDFVFYSSARSNPGRTILHALLVVTVYFVGATIIERRTGHHDRLRETGWFIAIACVATPAAAGIATSIVDIVFDNETVSVARNLQSFFVGDAIAVATIVPVLRYLSGRWPPLAEPDLFPAPRRWSIPLKEVQLVGTSSRVEGIVQALSIAAIPIIVFGLGSAGLESRVRSWIALAVLPCLWVALRRSSLSAQISSLITIIALATGARWRLKDDVEFLQVQAVMLAGSFATLYAVGVGRAQRRKAIAERQIARQHYTRDRIDSTTGLLNRVGIIDEIARSPRNTSVICLGIDRFEALTDGIGSHDTDRVLNELATRMLAETEGCIVGRIEENTLAVVVNTHTTPEEHSVLGLARQLVRNVATQRMLTMGPDALRLPVTISAGVATGLDIEDKPEDLLRHARIALHRALTAGGNQVSVFDQTWRLEAERRHRTLSDLRDALDTNDQLFLAFQPIVRLSDRKVIAGEALVRWRKPDGSIVMPADFIEVAEHSGLISELGDYVFRLAVKQVAQWNDALDEREASDPLDGFVLHVNLSPRQLEDPHLAETLREYCVAHNVPTRRFCLELVETDLSTDPEHASRVLQTLCDAGFRLALDDFGTGFSTVSWLSRFPIHALKIDRVFVQGVAEEKDDSAIVELIINLGKQLHLEVSAEGVETDEQIATLERLGCTLAQGFRFSHPVAPDDFLSCVAVGLPLQ